jgi:hypothetical protein
MNFVNKAGWNAITEAKCLHCGREIVNRPCTIGIAQKMGGIITEGYFHDWCCVKAYCKFAGYTTNPVIMANTDIIYQAFKQDIDEYDDVKHYKYLEEFQTFDWVPATVQRSQFKRYGGEIDDNYAMELVGDKNKESIDVNIIKNKL